MIRFEGEQLTSEFKAAFGMELADLNEKQLWWLVKFGKHVRGRCRSNAAFNNYMNRNFNANFREVEKTDPLTNKTYPGLEISRR